LLKRLQWGHKEPRARGKFRGDGICAAKRCLIVVLAATLALPPNSAAATITWTGLASDSSYNNPVNWSPQTVPSNTPTQSFDALIGTSGQTYATNVDTSATINSLAAGSNTTLHVLGGNTLTLGTVGTGIVLTNGGSLNIDSTGQLNLNVSATGATTSSNTGRLTIAGTLGITGGASLTGGGGIAFNGGSISGTANDSLTTDNAITGSGTISGLTVSSASNGLSLSGQIMNSGTVQASGGQLSIDGTNGNFFENLSGGTLQTNGSNIVVTVSNNSTGLFNSPGGTISVNSPNSLTYQADGVTTGGTYFLTNNGNFNVAAGATLTFDANGDAAPTFQMGPAAGNTGMLALNGGRITGATGNELLVNFAGQNIQGFGSVSGLTLQNGGTLTASGGNLSISSLSDFDGQNLNNNGTYVTGSGANLQIGNASAGSGAGITTNNANIVLNGSGLITDGGNNDILSGFLMTNNGSLTLENGAALALNSAGLGAAGFTNAGTINVNDGSTLTLSSPGVTVTNNGNISLNSAGTTTSLIFDSGTAAATLTGSGTLTMSDNANNLIKGATGTETLINDVNHTIQGAGTIGNFASFTNNGTLSATSTTGNALIVAAPLLNWDGANLNGGNYSASGTLQLNSIGGNQIAGLANNANVTINGIAGFLTGDGMTNALGALSSITDSSLTISGATASITPGNLTLAVLNDGNLPNALSSLNVSAGGNLTINGSLSNASGDFANGSTIMVTGGSSLSVTGAFSQTTSAFANGQASVVLDGSPTNVPTMSVGGLFTQDALSALTLSDGATLKATGLNNTGTITVNDTSVADFRGGPFQNLQSGTLTGGAYNITGTFNYDGGGITTLQSSNVTLIGAGQMLSGAGAGTGGLSGLTNIIDSNLTLMSSTGLTSIAPGGTLTISAVNNNSSLLIDGSGVTGLTVNGGVTLSSGGANLPSASVTVQDSSALYVTGAYSQNFGSVTTVSGGSTVTARGLTNYGAITVSDATSVADFRGGSFTNLSGSVLNGGTYNVAGTFNYGGGGIQTLQSANVALTGGGQMLYGSAGMQAFSNLTNITDSSFTLNSSTLTSIKPSGGTLAISGVNNAASLTLNGGTLTINGSVTNTNNGASSTVTVVGGGTLNTGAFTQTGGDTLVGTSAIPASSGTLVVSGMFSQSAGSQLQVENGGQVMANGLNNSGSFIFVDAASKADFRGGNFMNLSGGALTDGSYKVAGQFLYDGGGITTIGKNASVDLIGSGALSYGAGAGTNGLNNTLQNNAGTLTLEQNASLTSGGAFNNQGGSLAVQSKSTLTVTGSFDNGSTTAGSVLLNGGGKLTVNGSFNNGQAGSILSVGRTSDSALPANNNQFTSNGLTNNGILVVGFGSTANVEGGAFTNLAVNGTTGLNTLTGGTYAIDGTFLYTGNGIQSIAANTSLSLDARSFSGHATDATIAGTGDAGGHDAIFTLQDVAGTLALSGGQTETVANGATNLMIDAGGALLIGAGANPLDAYNGGGGSGTLTVDAGLIDSGDVVVGNTAQASLGTGTLDVMGSLQQSGDLTMDGVVTVTGSYTENSTGILTYDLNSNSFNRSHQLAIDNFTVDGNAALNGTLDINFEQGFLPTLSTGTFTILTFGSDPGSSNFLNLEYSINGIYQGTFNPGSDSSFGNGFTFKEINTGSAIELEVVTATPEPSTWLMLAAGLLALGALELRRRNAVLRVQ